jgi:hypothetical protein
MNEPENLSGSADERHAVDELARRAGAAMRVGVSGDSSLEAVRRRGERTRRTRLVAAGAVGAIAAVGTLALVRRDGDPGESLAAVPAVAETTVLTTEPASTSAPSTASPTTSTAVPAAVLLDAAILPPELVGDTVVEDTWPLPIYSVARAVELPECQAFAGFFAATDSRVFGYSDTSMIAHSVMYAQVWSTEADAIEAVRLARSPGFDQCWAQYHGDILTKDQGDIFSGAAYQPMVDAHVDLAGDDVVDMGIQGTIKLSGGGQDLSDAAFTPIVRVGRVIFTLNFAAQVTPAEQLQRMVATIVERIETAAG